MYNKGNELLKLCNEQNKKISEIVIAKEMAERGLPYEELIDNMKLVLDTMISSSKSALNKEVISVSKLTGGDAKKSGKIQKYGKYHLWWNY